MSRQRVFVTMIGLAVFLGVHWLLLRNNQPGSAADPPPALSAMGLSGPQIPAASVTRFLDCVRRLNLQTAEIVGHAAATASDESWRGVASATVSAPVRYLYGVNLEALDSASVSYNEASETWVLTLPAPERMAAEVDWSVARESLDIRGLRLRSRAGEAVLRRAREAAQVEAHSAPLTESMQRQVYDQTRLQVAEAVSRLAADGRKVSVRLSSEPQAGPTLAAAMDR